MHTFSMSTASAQIHSFQWAQAQRRRTTSYTRISQWTPRIHGQRLIERAQHNAHRNSQAQHLSKEPITTLVERGKDNTIEEEMHNTCWRVYAQQLLKRQSKTTIKRSQAKHVQHMKLLLFLVHSPALQYWRDYRICFKDKSHKLRDQRLLWYLISTKKKRGHKELRRQWKRAPRIEG